MLVVAFGSILLWILSVALFNHRILSMHEASKRGDIFQSVGDGGIFQSVLNSKNKTGSSKLVAVRNNRKAQDSLERPWHQSKTMPQWMKDYFQWHSDSINNITALNWHDYKYMVIRCLATDLKCGGTADRLQSLPFLVLVASKARRLLFFKWERPAPLEEYLQPPIGGLQWSWPPHESIQYAFGTEPDVSDPEILYRQVGHRKAGGAPFRGKSLDTLPSIISVRVQIDGQDPYNAMRTDSETEASFNEVFRDCWYSTFVPSTPVQKLIDENMESLRLTQNKYHGIHIRSLYHSKMKDGHNNYTAKNAFNCLYKYLKNLNASNDMLPLRAETPVYVATDQKFVSRCCVRHAQVIGFARVVTRLTVNLNASDDEATLHLDRGESFVAKKSEKWTMHEASRYYDTFIDLYMLSYAQCMVFNVGVSLMD